MASSLQPHIAFRAEGSTKEIKVGNLQLWMPGSQRNRPDLALQGAASLHLNGASQIETAAGTLSRLQVSPSGLSLLGEELAALGIKVPDPVANLESLDATAQWEMDRSGSRLSLQAATGAGIGWAGIQKIFGDAGELVVPGQLALIAAVVSILSKEGMYWYTRAAAKKIESSALMADAWHHRSDALSSIGSFAGVLGARLGMPVLDPVASVVICLFILKAAWDIFQDAISKMIDRACPAEMEARMRTAALEQEGVLGIDRLQTRLFGDRIYVEIDIAADADSTLAEAHTVADRVHDCIEEEFPKVKHCMVHVNPFTPQPVPEPCM